MTNGMLIVPKDRLPRMHQLQKATALWCGTLAVAPSIRCSKRGASAKGQDKIRACPGFTAEEAASPLLHCWGNVLSHSCQTMALAFKKQQM